MNAMCFEATNHTYLRGFLFPRPKHITLRNHIDQVDENLDDGDTLGGYMVPSTKIFLVWIILTFSIFASCFASNCGKYINKFGIAFSSMTTEGIIERDIVDQLYNIPFFVELKDEQIRLMGLLEMESKLQ